MDLRKQLSRKRGLLRASPSTSLTATTWPSPASLPRMELAVFAASDKPIFKPREVKAARSAFGMWKPNGRTARSKR
jgi:hypothetical protein